VRRCSRSGFVLSRVIPNTIPNVYWANREVTWVGSCEERTKSVRRYREANTDAGGILAAFWRKARSDRCPEFFAGFPVDQMVKDLRNVWRQPARRIYRNWLLYMAWQRTGRSSGGPRPGRRLRSVRRILARQPNEEARPDPTTEFGP
jgi:hypothetical protein